MNRRLLVWALRLLFYVCLDVATGAVIYAISVGEVGLTPGQLAIRILTAMALASAIVGGPDIMLYWQESGRRIKAEEERDAVVVERDTVAKERDIERDAQIAAEKERDAALADVATIARRLDELSTEMEQLRNERAARRPRARRRLRNNGQ